MKKFKPFSIVFALVFIFQLYAEYEQNLDLIFIGRPLIALILMLGLYVSTGLVGKFKKKIFFGLSAAFIADLLLMLQSRHSSFFIYGMAAYLICNLFYISAFQLDIKSDPDKKNPYFLKSGIVLAVFCSGFFIYLQSDLGVLRSPILIYLFILTVMVIFSVGRFGRVNLNSFKLVITGAILLLLSNAALIFNKFTFPIPNAGVLVMGLYMVAQYLIVSGTIVRELVTTRTEIK